MQVHHDEHGKIHAIVASATSSKFKLTPLRDADELVSEIESDVDLGAGEMFIANLKSLVTTHRISADRRSLEPALE